MWWGRCTIWVLFVLCEWGGGIAFVMLLDKTNGVITECVFRHGNKSYNYRTPLQAQRIVLHHEYATALQKLLNAKHKSSSLGHNKLPVIYRLHLKNLGTAMKIEKKNSLTVELKGSTDSVPFTFHLIVVLYFIKYIFPTTYRPSKYPFQTDYCVLGCDSE